MTTGSTNPFMGFTDDDHKRIAQQMAEFRESLKPTLRVRQAHPRYEVQWQEWMQGWYAHGYGTLTRTFWRRASAERFIARYNRRQERNTYREAK